MNNKKRSKKDSLKINKDLPETEFYLFITEKIQYIQEIIRNTISSIKKNIDNEIFSNNDANLSISVLIELYEKTTMILKTLIASSKSDNEIIELLQKVIDKLSMIICGFGTKNIEDLLFISFGSEFKNMKIDNLILKDKYEIIKKYIQPIGYKIVHWKTQKSENNVTNNEICVDKITENQIQLTESNTFECFDNEKTNKSFFKNIYGIQVVIQNEKTRKTLIISGIVEDIQIDCFTNKYIQKRILDIKSIANEYEETIENILLRVLETLSLKEILIYGNEDIKKRMIAVFTEVKTVKQNKLDITIKKFLELDINSQRSMLVNLLIYNNDDEIQYICYLLYDLITANSSNSENKREQQQIYESLPWKIKNYFKDVVKHTLKYTNDMIQKYDINRITLEQQIYLLKGNEIVKEKAMSKLKEIKGKSDESGTKAKQYLEGLIKIPFGIFKEEPILKKTKDLNKDFLRLVNNLENLFPEIKINKKEKYSNIDIINYINTVNKYITENVFLKIEKTIESNTNKQLTHIIQHINIIKKSKKQKKFSITNTSKQLNVTNITQYLKENQEDESLLCEVYDEINESNSLSLMKTKNEIKTLNSNISQIENSMKLIMETLDESIYGHSHAKNQIMKIIAQWMSGEQTGYCFGFEGSPGVGKTSLAKKGLSNCLKDENGGSRPFSFIALGGSCSGSSIEGHGYTYLNSTWGKIADILMDSKCMNPIIYVDELDKVSKTENGKDIFSIFTHLIDSTQNDTFQDKYFSGIDLDLSKALFIFSYNDPDQIDRILLDRIHRIKFDNLSIDDKMVIVRKYIMPEINKKMGFENIVEMSDDIIEYIIETYTMEPGVRKLKELLFDLYGEINLNILKSSSENIYELPIQITKQNLENKFLIKYNKINDKKIHNNPEIGIINGLWANALGKGGIIPIQSLFYPSSVFLDLKLTGLQGDVMKESMNVAKTLAWNLTDDNTKKKLLKHFEETKCQGLHIHCPEGSVSKDGPSAGTAITIAIYSLLNKKLIKNDVAVTGEISLNGEITSIGGLDIKIQGGIKSGITTFLFPKANNKEYNDWRIKNKNKYENIKFIEVSKIKEVFEYVFA
uniref:Lon proteolytic domain-containing protein n=1 Tax=viral metagenome TaxID=1070528 RepID=A0A6C0JDS0_9ZZZZ